MDDSIVYLSSLTGPGSRLELNTSHGHESGKDGDDGEAGFSPEHRTLE